MERIDAEGVDRVAEPIEIAADSGWRPDGEIEREAVLVLLLARDHAQFHGQFTDEIGVEDIGLMGDFQKHN